LLKELEAVKNKCNIVIINESPEPLKDSVLSLKMWEEI